MRSFLVLLGFSILILVLPVNAQDNTQETEVRNLSAKIAAENPNVNMEMLFNQFMMEINGVQKVVGKLLDYRLALQIAQCSDLVSHPDDPGKYGRGMDFSEINAEQAIQSCEIAFNYGGDNIGLVLANLSRAYNKAEKYDFSFRLAKQAVEVGYPYGNVLVAQHYFYGDGIKKDQAEQFRWFKKAAEQGVAVGMRATAENYVDGTGTVVNYEQAYFWSLQAIKENHGKAFYQLAKVLEGKATSSDHTSHLLILAKQAFEVAAANGVYVEKDINRINKALSPNRFSSDAMAFTTPSGRTVNGKFVPESIDLNWYLLRKNRKDKGGNVFAYARASHERNFLTVWYQHAANGQDSGWYVKFTVAAQIEEVKSMSVTSTISGNNQDIALDLSDTKVENELFNSNMIGRINFRDVLLLSKGEFVNIRYKKALKKNISTYKMALNDAKIYAGNNKTQSAKIVFAKLIQAAQKLDENCCDAPSIEPLSERYGKLYQLCKEKDTDYLIANKGIRQNCHTILKNAEDSYRLIAAPFQGNLDRLLYDIDLAMSK